MKRPLTYRWVMFGTNRATGKRHNVRSITINRSGDGKIVDDWHSVEEAIGEQRRGAAIVDLRRHLVAADPALARLKL
ncbi:MAG: ester cyclase [Chloroflexota bacterium]|nr:ester cyclase [Chloroflexota bacterium]